MTEPSRPRLPRGVRLREDTVRKRWVLLGPERIFDIDAIGVEILKRCDGKATVEQIVASLAQAFNAPPERVAKDVQQFLGGLVTKRIIDL